MQKLKIVYRNAHDQHHGWKNGAKLSLGSDYRFEK
jgi:hypothetical protein